VTLRGALVGKIWMPGVTAQLIIAENLLDIDRRREGGLIDAIKSVVDNAGDFQSAKLTADSFVRIEHSKSFYDGKIGRAVTLTRYIDVANLPSLADYVSDTPTMYPE
jgi:hypothetical protein